MSFDVTKQWVVEDLPQFVEMPKALLRDIGDLAIRLIRSRTERGIDVNGVPFQALSDDYADAKREAGLPAVADLTVSGRMLNDMRASVPAKGVTEIRFTSQGGRATGGTFIQRSRAVGAADKAYFHDVAGAGKSRVRREFFGLTDADETLIVERVRAYLQQVA